MKRGGSGSAAPFYDSQTQVTLDMALGNHENLPSTLGSILQLMLASPRHRLLLLSDLDWLVGPPIKLGQYSVLHHNNQLTGYVSWAFISKEVEERLRSSSALRFSINDWRSGDIVWITDMICGPTSVESIVAEVRRKVGAGKSINLLMPPRHGTLEPTVAVF
jgi:cytolysin-activating lysine-acyltransferase